MCTLIYTQRHTGVLTKNIANGTASAPTEVSTVKVCVFLAERERARESERARARERERARESERARERARERERPSTSSSSSMGGQIAWWSMELGTSKDSTDRYKDSVRGLVS